ncbi:hypothetical protein M8818_003637 [Zalaria obscura]|uniref:Uncharacterized protein n=1 Tax=Zalaria obscura TaxID=2024903 RepID=A0ACC3SFV3_9PEZI
MAFSMHLAELFGGIADKLRVRGQTEEQIQRAALGSTRAQGSVGSFGGTEVDSLGTRRGPPILLAHR